MSQLTTTCRSVSELNHLANKACSLFLKECISQGINVFITETYRSQERQNYLYEQGRTRQGNIVTWTRISRHTSRMAWDIACRGNNLYDKKILEKAGATAKALGITWGGTWTTPDYPHFEINSTWQEPINEPIKEENKMAEKIYNTINEVPQWAVGTIKKLLDKGYLNGDSKGFLGLDYMALKVFVVNDRAGLYD